MNVYKEILFPRGAIMYIAGQDILVSIPPGGTAYVALQLGAVFTPKHENRGAEYQAYVSARNTSFCPTQVSGFISAETVDEALQLRYEPGKKETLASYMENFVGN